MDSPDLLSDLTLPGSLLPLPTLTNDTYSHSTSSDSSKKQTDLINEPGSSGEGKADVSDAKSEKLSNRNTQDELEEETTKSQLDGSMESSSSHSPSNPTESESQLLKELSKSRREVEEEEREKMQVLVSNFTEDQLDRYEMFRRAAFPKAAIKRIMQTITGNSVSQNVVIAMSGIAKVFVGELVEEALDVMDRTGESGPVQPKHLREAVRKLRQRGMIPNSNKRRFTPYHL